jgi:hypothetical protein
MKCAGCSREAKYLVFDHKQPHCAECMHDAMGSVPTPVIDIEAWEAVMRLNKPIRRIAG